MKTAQLLKGIFACLVVLAISIPASAAVTFYDKEGMTISSDASFNTFYVYSDSNKNSEMEAILGVPDRKQSRVKMGFLPNWIGFNFNKDLGDMKVGGRSSFWATINDSDHNLTETGIDVRQFYGTVGGDWGQVLIGKDFTLFQRSNIFLDEILQGYGNVSDTLGLIDGGGVSFGNIGTGYTYPFPKAQITYRTPNMSGFVLAIGAIDPSRTNLGYGGEEKTPRFEGELTYNYGFDNGSVTAWVGGLWQKSESDSTKDVTSKGVSFGLKGKYAGFTLAGSGFDASGVGFELGPGADTTLGLPVVENEDELDSWGYLLQASYIIKATRLVASYGRNKLDADADNWKNRTITGAVFYAVNDYLSLCAEYNNNEIKIGSAKEEVNTVALGGIINF